MRTFALVLLAGAAVGALVTGCSKQNTVAEINGDKITYQDCVKESGTRQLAFMLERRMVLDLAKKKGVPPTDEQVNRRLEYEKNTQDIEEQYKRGGLTLDDLKRELKVQQAAYNLALQMMKDRITEDDVDKAYNMNEWMYNGEEGRRVEVLYIPDQAAAGRAEAELKKGATLEIAAQANAYPMVIRKNDPRPESAELIRAAFATPEGKATPPIKLGGGMQRPGNFMILRVVSKMGPYKTDEKDAKILVKEDLAIVNNGREVAKLIDAAKKDANITIAEPTLKGAEKEFRNCPGWAEFPGRWIAVRRSATR